MPIGAIIDGLVDGTLSSEEAAARARALESRPPGLLRGEQPSPATGNDGPAWFDEVDLAYGSHRITHMQYGILFEVWYQARASHACPVFRVPVNAGEETRALVARKAEAAVVQAAIDAGIGEADVRLAVVRDIFIAVARDGRRWKAAVRTLVPLVFGRPPDNASEAQRNAFAGDFADRILAAVAARRAEERDHPEADGSRKITPVEEIEVVPAHDVGVFLAQRRPPDTRSVRLHVPPHAETGSASHDEVLNAVLHEIVTMWPAGTTAVVHYRTGRHLRAFAQRHVLLTEIGEVDPNRMPRAVEFGWTDARDAPERIRDSTSQPMRLDCLVREWSGPTNALGISSFLAYSVRELFASDPGAGFMLRLFTTGSDDDETAPQNAAAPPAS